jgi:sulfite reductase (NADPH) hemoprotein beta-component
MTGASTLQAVTANDLLAGDVVYFTPALEWSRNLADAAIAETDAEAQRLLAAADRQQAVVVGPYLIAVAPGTDGAPQPVHYRERIRTRGPSNRPDLGRQAGTRTIGPQDEPPAVRRQEQTHVPL